ncbi:MAG: hypothetical protein R3B99_27300 [Polyangiales bacterium]
MLRTLLVARTPRGTDGVIVALSCRRRGAQRALGRDRKHARTVEANGVHMLRGDRTRLTQVFGNCS